MAHSQIFILPLLLLLLTAVLKLVVGRDFNNLTLLESICELPVDLMFLSVSFITTYVITVNHQDISWALSYCIGGILISAFVVLIWRSTVKALNGMKKLKLTLLLVFNITISVSSLVKSVNLVAECIPSKKIDQGIKDINSEDKNTIKGK